MGTRSTYRIIQQWETDDKKKKKKIENDELCLVYRQFDGYPEGHPVETAEWLCGGKVVNGLGLNETELVFNGGGCLAAQLICKMKSETGPGGCYIHSLDSRGKCWEDYLYDIIIKPDRSIEYVCYENYGENPLEIFRGSPQEFVEKYKKKVEV